MHSKIVTAIAALSGLMFSLSSHAGSPIPNDVPEPGTWALVGLAGVIGWAVTRSKRK